MIVKMRIIPSYLTLLSAFVISASAQDCPSGWTKRVGFDDCYLVVSSQSTSWDEAREACHELDGDLVSVDQPGENEWLVSHLSGVLLDYWIGLIDTQGSGNFVWSDGSTYDPDTAYWSSSAPPSSGSKSCVYMDSLFGNWYDKDCSNTYPYICERSLAEPIKCAEDEGWMSLNNKCFKYVSSYMTWDGAQAYCEDYDADLVDVNDDSDQQVVNDFVKSNGKSVWIGLRDDSGNQQFDHWSSGADVIPPLNWAPDEPNNFTSSCGVVENQGESTGPWSTEDCYDLYHSICEKKEGMCYPGWKIHKANCYQFVANQKETWYGAKHICDGQGGFMLTVETQAEQDFIVQQLPRLQLTGSEDFWIGLSDWEEDGTIKWVDGTVLTQESYQNFPNHQIPTNGAGEVQCGSIYVDSPTGQWQYGDCFEVYDYVCEIPEGAVLKPYNPTEPKGFCDAGWSYFDQSCYFFNETRHNFQDSEKGCAAMDGHLVSVHSPEEQSFLSVRLSDSVSYLTGLNDQANEGIWEYTDGSQFDFISWSEGEPNDGEEGEDCVEMRGYTWDRGMWNDIGCSETYLASICKKDAATATAAPPTNPPPPLTRCYSNNGAEYSGQGQVTIDGQLCERWDDMTDQVVNPISYPDGELIENYCRNPNNGPAPWCYVSLELGVGWKVCDIPTCSPGVDCYEGDGYSYRGKAQTTEEGAECLYWGQLASNAYYRPENFPDAGLNSNYCRNPSGSRYGPWCYYNQTSWGSYLTKPCSVERCNVTGCYEGNGESYRGSVSTTEEGDMCLMWNNVTNHEVNPKRYPHAGLDENYCRNPINIAKPWCYIDTSETKAPCDVHQCSGDIGCYTYIGVDYRGKAHFTTGGVECLYWGEFMDEFYPEAMDAFTRYLSYYLPVSDYTQISNVDADECAEFCLNSTDIYCRAFNYQYWGSVCHLLEYDTDDASLSFQLVYNYYERNKTFGLERNFCRNPTYAAAPWCYYANPKTEVVSWTFCAVPECNPEDPGCYNPHDYGVSYRGTGHTSASGHTCMAWEETTRKPEDYPNAGLEANYCRNPTGYSGGPFCYYPGSSGPYFEYCDVPQCEVEDVCGDGCIENPRGTFSYKMDPSQGSSYKVARNPAMRWPGTIEVCGEGWIEDPSGTFCYKIESSQESTYEATRDLCLREDADLLSIASPEEQAFITGIIREERVVGFWVGLNDLYNEAGWRWSDGGPFSYLNWAEDQPDNADGGEHCTVLSTHNGEWSDEDCELNFAHICKKGSKVGTTVVPTTALPGGGCYKGWSGYGSHCYLIEKDRVDWTVAQSYCHVLGAELASVHSIGEMQHLTAQISEVKHSVYWFGANDILKEDHWVFSNGTSGSPEEDLKYTHWADGEPNDSGSAGEHCAAMLHSWGWEWNDYRCSDSLPYVCQGVTNPQIGEGKFAVYKDLVTFADAEQNCRSHGGTLATIGSQGEMDQLAALLNQVYDPFETDTFWFGCNDLRQEGNWVMGGDADSNQNQFYTNWHQGEPNNVVLAGEDCASLIPIDDDYTWRWNDQNCDVAERFICEEIDPEGALYRGHRYSVVDEVLPWDKATQYCNTRGGQLARIQSAETENFIEHVVDEFEQDIILRSKGVWIGLNDKSHQDYFEWSDGSKVTYTNWNSGEPSNFARKEDCTFVFTSSGTDPNGLIYQTGRWGDYDCGESDFGYICQKGKEVVPTTDVPPPQKNCPEGWLWTTNYCYFVTSHQSTWQDAKETCRQENTNLATINAYYEMAELMDRLYGLDGLFWIGLNDLDRMGFYQWVDGSPVAFTYWDLGQPDNSDGRCVAMAVGREDYGEWDDQTCDSRYRAVCQKLQDGAVAPILPATPSPGGICWPGWSGLGSYCYQIVRAPNASLALSWEDARQDCRQRSSMASLVTLHNATVEDWLKQEAAKLTPKVDDKEGFWIGLNDRGTDGYYYWTGYVDHNYVLEYVNWGESQPDDVDHTENCVQMYLGMNSGGWEDMDCALKRNWVCEMPKTSSGTTTEMPTVKPSDSPLCGNDSSWAFYNGACYHLHGTEGQGSYGTWDSAEADCQRLNAHLVSIHTPTENSLVKTIVSGGQILKIWIGMRSYGEAGYQWSDGTPVEYVTWSSNQPDDRDGELACLTFSSSTNKWSHGECEETLPYMCKKVPGQSGPPTPPVSTQAPGYCSKGWSVWGNKCYRFFPHGGDWGQARNVCLSSGGDLATIRNSDEQLYLITLLEDISYGVWIGLSDTTSEGHYSWADRSDVTYTNWAHLEPNGGRLENCVEIRHSMSQFIPGSWNDASCDSSFGALCQKPRDSSETAPPPTQSACAEGYSFYENSCYRMVSDPHAFEDANYACRDNDVEMPVALASISDIYEQSYMELLLRKANLDSPVWIGLRYNETREIFSWVDLWPVYYTNWATGEPSHAEGEGCAAFLETGRWDNRVCTAKLPAICKYTFNLPPIQPTVLPIDCPDLTWTAYGRYCFKAFTEEEYVMGQPSAKYHCSREHDHTDLASLHSPEENDFVSHLVEQVGGIYSIWLGLENQDGAFTWTDNSAVDFSHWNDNEPSGLDPEGASEECVEMFTGGGQIGRWNDLSCLAERAFVCKYTSPNFIEPTPLPIDGDEGMSLAMIIGISVGSAFVLVIFIAGSILIRRQRRMLSYFHSIAGTGVSHANLYNEEDGVDEPVDPSRDNRSGSFDDAMLRVN